MILDKKEELLNTKAMSLNHSKYTFLCDVLGSGHCKREYVIAMGEEFWEEKLEEAISAGKEIGKTERHVKQNVSYAMVSIYEDLELYDKAYDFLVEQAEGYSWLHLFTVKNIVQKVGYCERLKSAINKRLTENNLLPEYRAEFERIKTWLVFDFKK